MEKISSGELKKISLDILIYFSKYCEEHNLKYWLWGGTLIGCVRHKGFIPWDDDIDVAMPREDYDIFINSFEDSDKYKLCCHDKYNNYYYPFAKICDVDTLVIEEHFECGVELGVYLDIFPVDGEGNDFDKAKKHLLKCQHTQYKLNNTFLKHFFKSNEQIKDLIRYLRFLALRLIGSEYYIKKLDRYTREYKYSDSVFVANNVWGAYGERELLLKSWMDELVLGEFCDNVFWIPKQYDELLTAVFNDYMTPPPMDERKSHHDMSVYYK